jgi:SAM-dependent MidA family methyltransferase
VPSEADPHGASSAVDDIRRAIDVAGGSLRFDEFMSLALYGPNGFYTGVGRAGRRGDFLTSPEVGPLFGTVLAAWIDAEFDRLGRPDEFEVIEVGAGPGTLARSILAHWRATSAVSHPYTAVEAGALQRAAHPEGVRSVGGLEERADRPITGVVLANELLDNLPFRLLVFDGRWRESHVTVASGEPGRLLEVLVPLADPPSWLPDAPPHGARVPWQQAARSWVETTIGSIAAGRLLCFDYVTPRSAELAATPWRAWLRTYRGHERGGHYLSDPGGQDVTTQVALDQLPEPDVVRTQEQFLRRWGIDDLVEEGRAAWEASASAPTVAAMKMRSRVREAEALLDPAGLGGFLAIEWSR